MKRALLIVDVQNDFCEGGSLPVTGGVAVAGAISAHVEEHASDYDAIVATADWHVDPGEHWATDGEPDFATSWPVHCEVGTQGADFRPELAGALAQVQQVFRKGEHEAAYSGFGGSAYVDGQLVGLGEWLRERGIGAVDVCGIATDHCVRATALDARRQGLATTLLLDLCAGVAPDTSEAALTQMREAGVDIDRR